MNPRIWKWINRIFLSGIWVQPFAMAGLIWFFKNVLQGDVSTLSCLSCPSFHLYISGQRIRENRLPGKWISVLKIRSMTDRQNIPVH